jgi:Asp-tRNA(Asn)/Glu-tRNA(Gln) amidotransferase A subunit family amidase
MSDILDLPISQQADKVKNGEISAVALTESALSRTGGSKRLAVHSCTSRVTRRWQPLRRSIASARAARPGQLSGVPIAIKDALGTADARHTLRVQDLTRRNAEGTGGSGAETELAPSL